MSVPAATALAVVMSGLVTLVLSRTRSEGLRLALLVISVALAAMAIGIMAGALLGGWRWPS